MKKQTASIPLQNALGRIENTFVVGLQQKWVIMVGDGKTYDLLQDIKSEYGSHLKWLIPLPGDWHILLNYQKTLIKIYGDAGLVQLGKVAGYRWETLTSLVNCSNFRRTHAFLLQSFEAFYRTTLKDLVFTISECTLWHLENGGFSVRITPSEWHAVALDECHEMKIDKDAKFAIIRPNEEKMKHLSNFLCSLHVSTTLKASYFWNNSNINTSSSRDVAIEVNAE